MAGPLEALFAGQMATQPSVLDRLMSETIVPRQPGKEDAVTRMLGAPADWSQIQRRGPDPVEMALGLAGGPSMAMFAGPMAKTANHQMLARAKGMLGKATPEQIWKETGWFQGAEGKWRFEIPDNASKMNPHTYAAGMPEQPSQSPVAGQLWHPDLYAAYPEMRGLQATVQRGPAGGRYYPLEGVDVSANTPAQARSVTLHELQHDIQQRENFAKGATPDRVPMADYGRSAGEVEARNVQRRLFMTPEERAASPPWTTEGVPRNEQIIRLLMSQ